MFLYDKITATSGVPQGSVLGPLLFIIFINDISYELKNSTLLYADDCKLYSAINNLDDCLNLQKDLQQINTWCDKNKLHLNINKCKYMTFTRKLNPIEFTYVLNDVHLARCTQFKDLGVIFDSKLTFCHHINDIVTSSYRNLGFIIRNTKEFMDNNTLILLFNAFVRSKLEYASIIWSPEYAIHKLNVEKTQRIFSKYLWYKNDGIYPARGTPQCDLLSRYQIHDLESRRKYFSVVFLHKILNNQIDCPDLCSYVKLHVPAVHTRSNNSFYLIMPHTNVLKSSPLHSMCSNYAYIQNDVDIFCTTVNKIKQSVLHLN